MKTVVFFLIFLFAMNIVYAQKQEVLRIDTLSTDKLIENFRINNGLNDSEEIHPCDKSMWFEEGGISILSNSPLDSEIEGISRKVCAEWSVKYKDGRSLLCLKKVKPIGACSKEEAEEIYSNLKNKYTTDWEYGIPAKWFTGEIRFIHCPKALFGEVVAKHGYLLGVKEGYIISRKLIKAKYGTLESSMQVHENGFISVRLDGCWWDDIQFNTDSLNRFINKTQPIELKKTVRKEYAVLLVINSSTGKNSFRFLFSKTMDANDKANIAFLKKRLEELPAWSYGPLLALDGRFIYGRYFKALLSGGEWTLKDYILEEEKIVSIDELISNFRNADKRVVPNDFLKQYDPIMVSEGSNDILIKSPLRRLPGSVFARDSHAEWGLSSWGSPFYLCLKRILPIGIDKAQAKRYEGNLADLFGRKPEGIYATWFTGDLVAYGCPQNLFGEFVSGEKTFFKVEKGAILKHEYVRTKAGTMDDYFRLRSERIEGSISIAGYNDGCWIYGSDHRAQALSLFVNDSLSLDKRPNLQKEFMFLMYTDLTGVSTIHLLQPEKPDATEIELVADLKQQIAKLPKWSFGWLETINGAVFPGCYLKAKYSGENGWDFTDCAYENTKKSTK